MAKKYSGSEAPGFVNGILGTAARAMEAYDRNPVELESGSGAVGAGKVDAT